MFGPLARLEVAAALPFSASVALFLGAMYLVGKRLGFVFFFFKERRRYGFLVKFREIYVVEMGEGRVLVKLGGDLKDIGVRSGYGVLGFNGEEKGGR